MNKSSTCAIDLLPISSATTEQLEKNLLACINLNAMEMHHGDADWMRRAVVELSDRRKAAAW